MSAKFRSILLLPCLTVLCSLTPCASAQSNAVVEQQKQRIATIANIAPTVVCVMPPNGQGGGSGVLISADGYAISNYHVTSGSGTFMKCGLNDGRVYDAVIVGIDPTGDVALIKLLGRDDFPFCTPGNSDLVAAGDDVMALGNPFLLASDFTPTVTFGIVSGVHRYQYPAGTFLEYTDCIQIDASINPGNSGGPLFDMAGRWIGINGRASFEKRGRINTGAAYAISVNQVLLFLDHLKSGRIVDHGQAEFTVATSPDGLVQVDQVSQLSEAWRRGLRPGDELVTFAGRSLSSANDFKNVLGIFPEGTRVSMTFRQKDGIRKATIRLQPLHGFDEAPPLPQERRPESPPGKPDGEEPDSEQGPHTDDADQPPAEYADLFEDRKGFANYYFNKQQQDRLLGALEQQISASVAEAAGNWQLTVNGPAAGTGELGVNDEAAYLEMSGLKAALQPRAEYAPGNEPPEFPGLLTGMLQWYRLFRNDQTPFSEIVYHGTEHIIPLKERVHVLITQDGTITSRWYFPADSALPVGVDVLTGAGVDEARIRFRNWNTEMDMPFPGQVGTVDNGTDEIRWLTVESIRVGSRRSPKAVFRTDREVKQ